MMRKPDITCDVVVVGAGPAGLCAAIAAHDSGAKTIIIEASSQIGGTAAWSAGAVWAPLNHHQVSAGSSDSTDEAVRYMLACADNCGDEELMRAYAELAPRTILEIENRTPLKFQIGTMPDYEQKMPGWIGSEGETRSLGPEIFELGSLGNAKHVVRRSPYGVVPFSFTEFAGFGGVIHPDKMDQTLYENRMAHGYVGFGEALIAALFAGILERHVEFHLNTRGVSLLFDGRRVQGLRGIRNGETISIAATRGVILASGGFEWNSELMRKHIPGPRIQPCTPDTNLGDGLVMAEQAEASIGNLGSCWGWPAFTELKGQGDEPILHRGSLAERPLPHSIIVDRSGRRFMDESGPYHQVLKCLVSSNGSSEPLHLPAFHIWDEQYRLKYPFGPVRAREQYPDWIREFSEMRELAQWANIDADVLIDEIENFNQCARSGVDIRYGRGSTRFANFFGDAEHHPSPNLGTIERAPFYCVEVTPSTIGTCGGPRITRRGEVKAARGGTIPGLFAAGNVTAAMGGSAYFGPGATIGPAMVFGFAAGQSAAS